MSDFSTEYVSGLTVYALTFNDAGEAWNGFDWVDRSANWADGAAPMVDTGGDLYEGSFAPSLPSGTYLVQSYLQVGSSPAESDPLVGTGHVTWPGPASSAGDFSADYGAGLALYALISNDLGLSWDGSAFVLATGPARSDCALAMAEGPPGRYHGAAPASLPVGTYAVRAYLRVGPAPADLDPVVGMSPLVWPGPDSPAGAGVFEKALAARLAADAMIAAHVGPRIYNAILPQTAERPAIAYRIASSQNEHNLDGPNGLVRARVEIRTFALSYSVCRDLKEQIRQMFDGFRGLLAGTVPVIETVQKDDPDRYDEPTDASDDGTHQVLSDYLFRYRVAIPNP